MRNSVPLESGEGSGSGPGQFAGGKRRASTMEDTSNGGKRRRGPGGKFARRPLDDSVEDDENDISVDEDGNQREDSSDLTERTRIGYGGVA